jgi:hypothetical protein
MAVRDGEIKCRFAIPATFKQRPVSNYLDSRNRTDRQPDSSVPCVLIAESFPQQLRTDTKERDPEKRDFGYFLQRK